MVYRSVETTRQQRLIRVFVSSTFRDMFQEREEVVKRVFPQLGKLCESRGVTLVSDRFLHPANVHVTGQHTDPHLRITAPDDRQRIQCRTPAMRVAHGRHGQ